MRIDPRELKVEQMADGFHLRLRDAAVLTHAGRPVVHASDTGPATTALPPSAIYAYICGRFEKN